MNSEELPALEASPSSSASPLMRALSTAPPAAENLSPRHSSSQAQQRPARSTAAGTADEGYNSGSFSRNPPPALEHPATLRPLDVPQQGEAPLSATESEHEETPFSRGVIYRADYDYDAINEDELTLRRGDEVELVSSDARISGDDGWWIGRVVRSAHGDGQSSSAAAAGHVGVFPANYVVRVSADAGNNQSSDLELAAPANDSDNSASASAKASGKESSASHSHSRTLEKVNADSDAADAEVEAGTRERERSIYEGPYEVSYADLELEELIGMGGFGEVYRARWRSSLAAVKKISYTPVADPNHLTPEADPKLRSLVESLRQEANLFWMCAHRNIVRLRGVCLQPPNLCLVMEFASGGSLNRLLEACRLPAEEGGGVRIPLDVLLDWARQIACGMRYLHDEAPIPLIHRDLKSSNILIRELVTDGEFEGKTLLITDFGLARQIVQSARNAAARTPQQLLQPPDASERKSSFDATAAGPLLSKSSSGAPVGTYPWMSPEAIRTGHFSKASDVWSYGVVLWELLTGETPYRGMNEVAVAYGVGANKLRLPLPSTCPAPIRELIEACWTPAAEARPSFAQLIERIDRIEQSGELELFAQGFLSLQTDWRLEIEAMFSDLRSKEDALRLREEQLEEILAEQKAIFAELCEREQALAKRELELLERERRIMAALEQQQRAAAAATAAATAASYALPPPPEQSPAAAAAAASAAARNAAQSSPPPIVKKRKGKLKYARLKSLLSVGIGRSESPHRSAASAPEKRLKKRERNKSSVAAPELAALAAAASSALGLGSLPHSPSGVFPPRLDSRASRLVSLHVASPPTVSVPQHSLITNTASNSSSNSSRRARVKPMTSKTPHAGGSKVSHRSKSVGSMFHRHVAGVPAHLSSQYVVNLDFSATNLRLECSLLASLRDAASNRFVGSATGTGTDSRTPGTPFSPASSTSNVSMQLASGPMTTTASPSPAKDPPSELRTIDLVVLKVSLFVLSFVLEPNELFSHMFQPAPAPAAAPAHAPAPERCGHYPSSTISSAATTAYPPETPSSGASIPMSIYESEPPQRTRFDFASVSASSERTISRMPLETDAELQQQRQRDEALSLSVNVNKPSCTLSACRSSSSSAERQRSVGAAAPSSSHSAHLLAPSAAAHRPLALTESDESEGEKHVRKLSILATPMFHRRFARSNSAVVNESLALPPAGAVNPRGLAGAEAAVAQQTQDWTHIEMQPYAESKSFAPVPLAQASATLPLSGASASAAHRTRNATRTGALGIGHCMSTEQPPQYMQQQPQQQQQQQQIWEAPHSAAGAGVVPGGALCAPVALRQMQMQRQLHYPMPAHRPLLQRQRKLTCIGVPLYENLAMANAAQQPMPPFNQLLHQQHAASPQMQMQLPSRALYAGGAGASASGSLVLQPQEMAQQQFASAYENTSCTCSPYRSHAGHQSQAMIAESDARADESQAADRNRHDEQQSSQNKVERYIQASNQQYESNTPTALRRARTRRLNTIAIPCHSGFSEGIIPCSTSGDAGSVPRSAQSSRDALQHTLADAGAQCASGCGSAGSSVSGLTGASPSQGTSPLPTPTGVKASILNRHLVLAGGSTPRRQRKYSVVRFDPLPIAESVPLDSSCSHQSENAAAAATSYTSEAQQLANDADTSQQLATASALEAESASHAFQHAVPLDFSREASLDLDIGTAAGTYPPPTGRPIRQPIFARHVQIQLVQATPASSLKRLPPAIPGFCDEDSSGSGQSPVSPRGGGGGFDRPSTLSFNPSPLSLSGSHLEASALLNPMHARSTSVSARPHHPISSLARSTPEAVVAARAAASGSSSCSPASGSANSPLSSSGGAAFLRSNSNTAMRPRGQTLRCESSPGIQPPDNLRTLSSINCNSNSASNSHMGYGVARARIASNASGQTGGCSSNQASPSSEACSSPAFRDAPNWNFNCPAVTSSWLQQQQQLPLNVRSPSGHPHLQQSTPTPIRPNLLHFAPPCTQQHQLARTLSPSTGPYSPSLSPPTTSIPRAPSPSQMAPAVFARHGTFAFSPSPTRLVPASASASNNLANVAPGPPSPAAGVGCVAALCHQAMRSPNAPPQPLYQSAASDVAAYSRSPARSSSAAREIHRVESQTTVLSRTAADESTQAAAQSTPSRSSKQQRQASRATEL